MSQLNSKNALTAIVIAAMSVLPAYCANPAQHASAALGVSSTWTGDTMTHSASDNSGKQLAVALPVAPVMPSKNPTMLSARVVKGAPKKKAQEVKFTIPAEMDDAADVCQVGIKRAGAFGWQKAQDLYAWAMAFNKQMSTTPVMTPLGGPYPPPSFSGSKLYVTNEGRLKTVVRH